MSEKLTMKDDIMFKVFFSKKGNEKYLREFLGAILGKKVKIKKIVHDARLEQLTKEQKYGVLDLEVELEDGRIINIEIQMQNNDNIEKRTTFYASKKVTEQMVPNEAYNKMKNVIIIIMVVSYILLI